MYLVRTADEGPSCLAVATLFLPGPRAYYTISGPGRWCLQATVGGFSVFALDRGVCARPLTIEQHPHHENGDENGG